MVFEKRGQWCWRDEEGRLHKFATEEEAKLAAGWVPPVEETLNGSKKEKKSSEEEASTDKQASVFSSKGPSKKKV